MTTTMTSQTATSSPDGWSLARRAAASLAAVRAHGGPRVEDRPQRPAFSSRAPLGAAGRRRREPALDGICRALRQTDMFGRLEEPELRRLAARCSQQALPEERPVFKRGEPSDAVFILREGAVAVFRDQRGRPVQELARLKAGSIFGELGVLHGSERGATVRTTEPCRLLRIGKRDFLRFLEEHGDVAARLEGLAARRHCRNAAAALDVDSRSDVRLHFDTEVTLLPADGRCRAATLENVSRGGLALSSVPVDWDPDKAVSFTLVFDGRRLDVTGRVAWRRGDTAGIAFAAPTSSLQVARFSRHLRDKLA